MDFPSVFDFADLDGRNGFTIRGVVPEPSRISFRDDTGLSVDVVGDINGDGIDDLIVGAPLTDANGLQSGASYVVFGTTEGFGDRLNLSELNGSNGFVINGIDGYFFGDDNALQGDNDRSGDSVSGAGDVNNDGIDDLIINAPGANSAGLSTGDANGAGESYVVFGSLTEFAPSLELSNLSGSNGFTITGVDGGRFVSDVSNAGDLNNDGIDDIIVGAPGSGGQFAGKSYVIFGRAGGFDSSIALDSLDGSNGFVLNGATLFDRVGESVSAAGDVNNDGIDDIVIGSPGAIGVTGAGDGAGYVVFGRTGSFGASLELSSIDGSNGFQIIGTEDTNTLGTDGLGAAVSNAGDVNGDGIDDILIGAPFSYLTGVPGRFTINFVYAGESYVVFGSEAGFGASFDVANLDGSNGFSIRGLTDSGELGRTLSAAGDINNDGIDDFVVGSAIGENYVVFGSRAEFDSSLDLVSIDGSNGFKLGEFVSPTSISGGGDINGDGISDLALGNVVLDNPLNNQGDRITIGGGYVVFGRDRNSTDIPLVKGKLATIYVDDEGTLVGNAFDAGEPYAGALISNTDGTENPNDVILGTAGDDRIWAGREGPRDIVVSGAGDDEIGLSSDSSGVNAASRSPAVIEAGAGNDFVYVLDNGFRSIEIALGSGDDNFWASGGNNTITGSGNNLIGIARGGDRITTGTGDDFVYATDEVNSVEDFIDLGDGNNEVWLLFGTNTITTGSGDDVIGMGLYNDTVDAGDGDNIVYSSNADDVYGTFSPNTVRYTKTVRTGSGDDYIQTGSGDDLLDGGRGSNSLYGGSGSDTFAIGTGAYNLLGDFELGSDLIQLDGLSFEQLAFYQGSAETGNADSTYIFVDNIGIAGVTNSTVAALDNAANFV